MEKFAHGLNFFARFCKTAVADHSIKQLLSNALLHMRRTMKLLGRIEQEEDVFCSH